MKTEVKYICELCGYRFNTEEECQQCEASHNNVSEVLSQKFDHHFGDNAKYPGSIIMKMANGHKIEYRYYKPILKGDTTNTDPSTPDPTNPTDPSGSGDPSNDPNDPIFDPTNP